MPKTTIESIRAAACSRNVKNKWGIIFIVLFCYLVCMISFGQERYSFEHVYDLYREIIDYHGTVYKQYRQKIDRLKLEIRNFLRRFPESRKRGEVERIGAEIEGIVLRLVQEEFAFKDLESPLKQPRTAAEIEALILDIRTFLRNYPRSIKRDTLKNKLDALYFRKFQLETDILPTSIADINRMIQTSLSYLNRLESSEFKKKLKAYITKIEGQRRVVYEKEFFLKAGQMFSEMRDKAIGIAKKSHRFSRIESIRQDLKSGPLNGGVARSPVICEYHIDMCGAILGINRFKVTVQFKAIIDGSLQTGVSVTIIDTAKTEDQQIKIKRR